MKRFSILTLVLTITLILSACGPEAAPTLSTADMLSTAAAVAYTMVVETQAAIPTATPPPTATITNTPAPTNTFVPLPTLDVTLTPAPSGNAGAGDPCVKNPLPGGLQGKTVRFRVYNSSKAALTLSVNLHPTVPLGECGYRVYSLDPAQSIVINDLVEGCYSLWAWNPDPKGYFMVTNGTDCLYSSEDWSFTITTKEIQSR